MDKELKKGQVQHCRTEDENKPTIRSIIRNITQTHFAHRIKITQEIKFSIKTSELNKNLCQRLIIHFIINLIVERRLIANSIMKHKLYVAYEMSQVKFGPRFRGEMQVVNMNCIIFNSKRPLFDILTFCHI